MSAGDSAASPQSCIPSGLRLPRSIVLLGIAFAFCAGILGCAAESVKDSLSELDDLPVTIPGQEIVTAALRRLERRVGDLEDEVKTLRTELASKGNCEQPARSVDGGGKDWEVPADVASRELKVEDVSKRGMPDDANDGIVSIDVGNTDWLKEVLFGGRPWMLYCEDKKDTTNLAVPSVFLESASQLKGLASFGKLDCWERTASGKTLAHRFDLPKPPVIFAVANGDAPLILDVEGLSKPWMLKRKTQSYLGSSVTRIDGPPTFKNVCTSRRACVIIGFKTAPMLAETLAVLQPVLEEHRGVRAVSVDTSVWRVKLDDKLAKTKPKKKEGQKERADMICISRRSGAGHGVRSGAFFRLTGDGAPTAENLEVFLDRCASGKNLVGMADAPRLSLRPPDKPKAYTPAPSPNPSGAGSAQEPLYERSSGSVSGKTASKGKASPAASKRPADSKKAEAPRYSSSGASKTQKNKPFSKAKGRNQDHVGSRQSLEEEEEPLFEAVEDPEDVADMDGGDEDASDDDDSDETLEL